MTGEYIFVGTSGWSYPKGEGTWNGYFYPIDKNIDELVYYSQFFRTVEINSTFYKPPDPNIAKSWARRVPGDFRFAVKLWQKFTHPKMFEQATGEIAAIGNDDVIQFCRGIDPLISAGKLGSLLAQFPSSFINDERGKSILQGIIKHFGQYHLALELRHRSWTDDPATAAFLRENHVAWVNIDEPKFRFSLADEVPRTADTAYFRFHGRNKEMWWKGDVETRYCYLYSPEEMNELAAKVRKATENSQSTFVFFNNHWKAYAPRNAADFMKVLGLPVPDKLPFQSSFLADE
jgi:uncharacterized protein YecE (DUF72 family)